MERAEAVAKLEQLRWKNLVSLAGELEISVFKDEKLNKGWAGLTVERYLGIQPNTSRNPNLGSWELKVVPLQRNRQGDLSIKETMAITMLHPQHVVDTPFEKSHVFTKLRRIIAVTRLYLDRKESESFVLGCNEFQLEGTELYDQIVEDYHCIQTAIKDNSVSGKIGKYIQPRAKGAGHGSTTRAFYARKSLVEYIIGWKHPVELTEIQYPKVDCPRHSGKGNLSARLDLDDVMVRLHPNQSGKGRHKCPYCAYQMGFNAGVAAASHAAKIEEESL